jgi:hypothetical protein
MVRVRVRVRIRVSVRVRGRVRACKNRVLPTPCFPSKIRNCAGPIQLHA